MVAYRRRPQRLGRRPEACPRVRRPHRPRRLRHRFRARPRHRRGSPRGIARARHRRCARWRPRQRLSAPSMPSCSAASASAAA
jgi:hypothetical protein